MAPKKDIQEIEDVDQEVDVKISFKDLENSMTVFTGDDTYPIETFIDEFEDVAQVMKWCKVEKLVYVKRLLDGTAKLFLRSFGRVKDYTTLKKALIEEFGPKINSAVIHKKLASRKMKNDETYQQYFIYMKELALHGNIEDAALIEYVIDGIRDVESNKVILYGATDMKEFRKKLDIYSDFRKKMSNKPTHSAKTSISYKSRKSSNGKRCFNCGDLDHLVPDCQKGIKCFKCNEFGHKSTKCTNKVNKGLNIQNKNGKEKIPFKKIKVNGEEMEALIDTGSDVNLIIQSEFQKMEKRIKDYDTDATILLTGIAERKLYTEGAFTANIQIDNHYVDVKFHVVKDNDIPVSVIVGNPILRDFEVNFTADGIYMQRIAHLTLSVEEKNERYNIEDSKYKDKIYKMCKEYKSNEKKEECNVDLNNKLEEARKHEDPLQKIVDDMTARLYNQKIQFEKEIVQTRTQLSAVSEELNRYKSEEIKLKELLQEKENGIKDLTLKLEMIEVDLKSKKEIVVEKDRQLAQINKQLSKAAESRKLLEEKLSNAELEKSALKPQYETLTANSSTEVSVLKEQLGQLETLKMRDKDDDLHMIIEQENIEFYNEKRQELRKRAKESIKKVQEENIRNYNRKRKEANLYKVGDLVAIKKTQFSQGAKLHPKYLGPYEVIKNQGNDRYAVKKLGNSEGPIKTTSSADFMKPWISPDDDSSETDE